MAVVFLELDPLQVKVKELAFGRTKFSRDDSFHGNMSYCIYLTRKLGNLMRVEI